MQTEVLREFIVAAKHSNFRKASEELHISQPALSNHMAALEREVGFQLFDRSGGICLTPAGAHFYSCAQKTLDLLADGIEESKEIAGQAKPVRIQMLGAEDSAINKYLSSIKTPFQTIPLNTNQTLFSSLKSGKTDILVAPHVAVIADMDAEFNKDDFLYLAVGKAETSLLVSSKSELAKKDSLTFEDLQDIEVLLPFGNLYDWISYTLPSVFKEKVRMTFVQDPSLPVGSDHVPLCDLGDRIMTNYRGMAHRCCQNRDDLIAIDKIEGRSFEAMEYLVYRADDPNPNVLAFVEEVRSLVGDVQDDANWRAGSDESVSSDAQTGVSDRAAVTELEP